MNRAICWLLGFALAWTAVLCRAQAGSASSSEEHLPPGTPRSWAEAAVQHQLAIIQDDDHPMRYVLRKIDRKGDTTREIIESTQGTIARLVQRDGKPITAAEDAAERARLQEVLDHPESYLKHEQRDGAGKAYAIQVIKLMPSATLYSYAPGQPQPTGATSPQVVIDFKPDPAFHPPSLVSEVLTGLEGRVWIDARTGVTTRIQAQVSRPVNVGWGVIARVYPGGKIELEQALVDGKRWAYTHVEEDVMVREMMLHTSNEKATIKAWGFQLLPRPVSFQDAVRTLLGEQIPLK